MLFYCFFKHGESTLHWKYGINILCILKWTLTIELSEIHVKFTRFKYILISIFKSLQVKTYEKSLMAEIFQCQHKFSK